MIYDYLIIGAGLGGLSAANFLAQENKSVLVLEKHDKPGGCLTSFERKGFRFDTGHEGLAELAPDEGIPQFLRYWGAHLKVRPRSENLEIFTGGKKYFFTPRGFAEQLKESFPDHSKDIDRFLSLNHNIMEELLSGGAPRSPLEMSFFEKMQFGIKSLMDRPYFMKYGLKNAYPIIKGLFSNPDLQAIALSRLPMNAVYMATAYRWETVLNQKMYYPEKGGMQALPDCMSESFKKHGGELRLHSEVEEILIRNNKVQGVVLPTGEEIQAKVVISNVSPPYTMEKMITPENRDSGLLRKIHKKTTFPSAFMIFYGMKDSYDLSSVPEMTLFGTELTVSNENRYNAENSPILLIPGDINGAKPTLVAFAPLSYDFFTEKNYTTMKEQFHQTLHKRIVSALGDNFSRSIEMQFSSTPQTFERYTHSFRGSYMGWDIDRNNYGKVLPYHCSINNLYFVGQYVFPGFGAMGVIAGGYFLANRLLKQHGIDLEARFQAFCTT